jgi:hypothetical protein
MRRGRRKGERGMVYDMWDPRYRGWMSAGEIGIEERISLTRREYFF